MGLHRQTVSFLVAVALLGAHPIVHAQSAANAPKGVTIHAAAPAEIETAKKMLQAALLTGQLPGAWLNSPTACGPALWKIIGPRMDPKLIADAATITAIVGAQPPFSVDYRAPRTPEQHKHFWKLMLETYPAIKTATVRPANASEIGYFWGLISFDIEEPLYTIDTGTDVFIVNMPKFDGTPRLFWIDRVVPYSELRKK